MPTVSQRAPRNRRLVLLPWALVIALFSTNVATLLNAQAHAVAFSVVDQILGVLGERRRMAITSSSTTVVTNVKTEFALKELRGRADRAEKALQQANNRVADLDAENKRLLNGAARQREMVSRIGSQGVRTLATRSARAITTAPARMVPYVGVGAEAAFLSWELQIDCELARSISELLREVEATPEDAGQVCHWIDKVPSRQQLWSAVKSSANGAMRKIYEVLERGEP